MKPTSELDQFPIADVRAEWARLIGSPPPPDLGRDLLTRGIEWHRRAASNRQLVRTMSQQLERLAGQLANGSLDAERVTSLKAGTRLVREWQGTTHIVMVSDDGYLWKGTHYPSLTKVAVAITGTNWSGPRFFGLGARTARTKRGAAA